VSSRVPSGFRSWRSPPSTLLRDLSWRSRGLNTDSWHPPWGHRHDHQANSEDLHQQNQLCFCCSLDAKSNLPSRRNSSENQFGGSSSSCSFYSFGVQVEVASSAQFFGKSIRRLDAIPLCNPIHWIPRRTRALFSPRRGSLARINTILRPRQSWPHTEKKQSTLFVLMRIKFYGILLYAHAKLQQVRLKI
jgi:hypothetical protein